MRHKLLSVFVFAFLLGCLGFTTAAHAGSVAPTTTFYFTGACWDCYDGEGDGTATLVLQNYTLGNELSTDNFVSFTYNGTDLLNSFSIGGDNVTGIYGSLNATPSDYEVGVSGFSTEAGSDMSFNSFQGGYWCIGGSCAADFGFSHDWSMTQSVAATPEPGSFALLGTGIAGLVSLRRRFVRA